jgi:hypothetical protein
MLPPTTCVGQLSVACSSDCSTVATVGVRGLTRTRLQVYPEKLFLSARLQLKLGSSSRKTGEVAAAANDDDDAVAATARSARTTTVVEEEGHRLVAVCSKCSVLVLR